MDRLETLSQTGMDTESAMDTAMDSPVQVSCERDDLAAAAAMVQRAVSSRTTLPILSGVLIETTPEGLRLVGTDLELSVETFLAVSATGHAAVVLPARYFGEIVRHLPEREVRIEFDAGRRIATISSGKAVYSINSMEAAEFPLFPQVEGNVWWKVQGKDLAEFVRQTAFAAATDENRPFLTGVLMVFGGNEARLAATDTFRLALRKVTLDGGTDVSTAVGSGQMIVPARALSEVARIIQNESGEVEVSASQNQVAFKCRKTTIVSRLIDGQFPNYDRVIPKMWKTRMVVERLRLLEAVERVAVLGKDEFGTVKLGYGGDTLTISANAPDVGMAFEEVAVRTVEGETGETALRARYLLDALRVVADEELIVEVTGAVSPIVLRQARAEGTDYLYLIMPVTVN
ncbi:MAG: DNA polymerase III subunit beta [Firmicutes bacterium]|jgi:DNA polymerase-3 subunit beta|nr:DNA polymerase III subunit beta [Bacillota bacterium]MDH7495866.1 DNA polymerase III subunit beta [Bacillota bacterium]